jgi:Mn2+/Fe2+ NRAMP family transporter
MNSERDVSDGLRQRNFSTQTQNTANIPDSPQGWDNLKWLGPSFLWMLSAAGSGELLFTPRIAALYGYTLLWALLAAVILKWFINGEVGRFSVCTGTTILEGFKQLPGPKNWAVWLILLPQIVVAISTVAGLAGAAGLMWYSYWVEARGYGAASVKGQESIDPKQLNREEKKKLRGWLKLMTISNTLAVVGALLAALSFLILGGELLRPQGLVPQENQVAETLGNLLGDLWGSFGFWFMVAIVFITFCSTVLSVEDGFGRMFADGTQIILQGFGVRGRWTNEQFLQKFYVVVLLTLLPIAVYLFFGEPVGLLQTAGGIEAAHIPIVTALTLYLNHRMLPKELQPSKIIFGGTAIAGIFFGVFAVIYLLQLLGVMGTGGG